MAPRRVILDVDVGTDDFLAILLFLKEEKLGNVKIEAITCSMGNTTLEHVCNNVVRLLELAQRTDIPVYRGASSQLIPPTHKIPIFHGVDGFGDLKYDSSPDLTIIRKEPSSQAMWELVRGSPNEISLICVGPLTNLALATRLYDGFIDSIKDLWIMGGNHTAMGNVTRAAEFNFYTDPEAANIVLTSVTKPTFILTWECSLLTHIPFKWRYEVFGAKKGPLIELLNKAERNVYKNETDEGSWLPCDSYLAAAFLYPKECIKKSSLHNATVELGGSHTRGQMVLDHMKAEKPNVTIIEQFDTEFFKQLIL